MAGIQAKRLYIIRPEIVAFSYNIRAVYLYSGVNIKLERLVAEKRSLFPALADLRKFSGNCSLSAIISIQTLFGIKPIYISTKTAGGRGL